MKASHTGRYLAGGVERIDDRGSINDDRSSAARPFSSPQTSSTCRRSVRNAPIATRIAYFPPIVAWVSFTRPVALTRSISAALCTASAASSPASAGGTCRRQTSPSGAGASRSNAGDRHRPTPANSVAQGDVLTDHLPQSFRTIAAQHEPELERPEATAERNAPVAEVHHLASCVVLRYSGEVLKVRSSASTSRTK